MNNPNIPPEYYKIGSKKLVSFSESILSVLNPSFSNSCWENPNKDFYDAYKQSKLLYYNSYRNLSWVKWEKLLLQNKSKWEQISYNYFPHPLYPNKQLLAITFSNSEIVPKNIRWKSLWMSNVHLPKWHNLQENFYDYNYISLWHIDSWRWYDIFSNVKNWILDQTWKIFWLWVNIQEVEASLQRSLETLLNPEIIQPETDKLLLWFDYFWIVPTFDEFKTIWDFLPGTFDEKLLILNIPLNWYRLDTWWVKFDVLWEIIKCYIDKYWEDEANWPKNIKKDIDKSRSKNPYHWINEIAMFWTKKPYRQKAFVWKTLMIETFVLDNTKKTYFESDMESYWFASMRTFVA